MLVVKKSKIPGGGNGLFTTSNIQKGDLIVEYKGKKRTLEQCKKLYGEKLDKAPYLYIISKNNYIDAQYTINELGRYANDANGLIQVKGLKNNAEYVNIKGRPYIVATKNIKPLSEILVDYGNEYWKIIKM